MTPTDDKPSRDPLSAPRGRFRRRKTAPPEAKTSPPGNEIKAPLVIENVSRPPGDPAILAGPLTDLARSFALQAEVLKQVHQSQQDMKEALGKDDKSQMVVNSTRALNDTFKGVRKVQQELLDELRTKDASKRWAPLIWGGLALILAGLGWWGWRAVERGRDEDRRLLDAKIERGLTGVVVRNETILKEQLTAALRRGERLEEELRGAQEELARLGADLREKTASVARLESALAEARERERAATAARDDLKHKLALAKESKLQLAHELDLARKETNRLREQVIDKIRTPGAEWIEDATQGKELPVVTAKNAAAGPSPAKESPVAQPAKPKAPPAGETARTVSHLNRLLSHHRGDEIYAVKSVRTVLPNRLEGVVLTESLKGKGVVRRIEAEKLTIAVDPRGDLVELEFKDGQVRSRTSQGILGSPTPFYRGRFRLTLEPTNGKDWLAQPMGFIRIE
ncbi:MAG TPA: hypothetical protein ENK43_15410 [Planctomycetes bacterium]|nr:hypothetical protein [Planctomycetota bacterium]